MSIKGTYAGKVISLKNGSGADATPNRVVVLNPNNPEQFIAPTGDGQYPLGVLLKDARYEGGVTKANESGSIQIDGVADIDCIGTVNAWHFVKIADATGKIVDAGSVDTLNPGGTQKNIVGVALESGTDGRVAVLLRPFAVFV